MSLLEGLRAEARRQPECADSYYRCVQYAYAYLFAPEICEPINPLDGRDFPDHPLYNCDPSWFLPAVGAWYRTRDWIDRRLAG